MQTLPIVWNNLQSSIAMFVTIIQNINNCMGNTCQNSRLQVINSFDEGIQNSLIIHKKDAPLPSYAVRASQRPLLNRNVYRIVEEELAKEAIAHEKYEGSLLPIFYIARKKAHYEGEWKARLPHGRGKIYFDDGHYFEGYFCEGEGSCRNGLMVFSDGSYYRGGVESSYLEGKGKFVSASGMTYQGDWKGNKPQGRGKEVFADGSQYEGDFVKGVKEGEGTFKWSDGKLYLGEFKDGRMHGKGKLTRGQTSVFEGEFCQNKKKGKGTLTTPYGVYEGQFEDGQLTGNGKFTWKDHQTYTGTFKDGLLDGEGILTFPEGKTFKGSWKCGQNQSLRQMHAQ